MMCVMCVISSNIKWLKQLIKELYNYLHTIIRKITLQLLCLAYFYYVLKNYFTVLIICTVLYSISVSVTYFMPSVTDFCNLFVFTLCFLSLFAYFKFIIWIFVVVVNDRASMQCMVKYLGRFPWKTRNTWMLSSRHRNLETQPVHMKK